jgi:hypothetical protein
VLPGDPSPTVAVLAQVSGLGLVPAASAFGFNGTLTTSFMAVDGRQQVSALRLDFSNGSAPPKSGALLQGNVFIDNGIPVARGTPLAVPIPSTVLPMSLGMAGLFWWHWTRQRNARS